MNRMNKKQDHLLENDFLTNLSKEMNQNQWRKLANESIDEVLVAREELGHKGMVLTHDKKDNLINFRLRY